MPKRVPIAVYSAVGGPTTQVMAPDGYMATPTDAGDFVIHACSPHENSERYALSVVRWGAEVKRNPDGSVMVKHGGKWQRLEDATGYTTIQLAKEFKKLYGTLAIPNRWVFNDFGHMTCYYFKDLNKNRKLDPTTEEVEGEMIHPTSANEAQVARRLPVKLELSHGCVHVEPAVIDTMIDSGYLAPGNTFSVRDYSEDLPADFELQSDNGGPYEAVFYPGQQIIVVYGQGKP